MAVPKRGLGRGLDSLFADTGSGEPKSGEGPVTTMLLREIEPDKQQPRKNFDETSLQELADSIKEHGLIQPILVRPNPLGGYRIIAGERRWRASRIAGLEEIPVIIRQISDNEAMEIALIENLQREDLDPIEEALGYQQLMDKFGFTQEETAKKVSKSRSAVANSLRLLSLPQLLLDMLKTGALSSGHAKVIMSLPEEELQKQAAQEVVDNALSVRKTEELVKKMQKAEKPEKKALPRPSFAAEVEIGLRETLGTVVKVKYEQGKGSLLVDFYSDEQLKDFANLLGKYQKE